MEQTSPDAFHVIPALAAAGGIADLLGAVTAMAQNAPSPSQIPGALRGWERRRARPSAAGVCACVNRARRCVFRLCSGAQAAEALRQPGPRRPRLRRREREATRLGFAHATYLVASEPLGLLHALLDHLHPARPPDTWRQSAFQQPTQARDRARTAVGRVSGLVREVARCTLTALASKRSKNARTVTPIRRARPGPSGCCVRRRDTALPLTTAAANRSPASPARHPNRALAHTRRGAPPRRGAWHAGATGSGAADVRSPRQPTAWAGRASIVASPSRCVRVC